MNILNEAYQRIKMICLDKAKKGKTHLKHFIIFQAKIVKSKRMELKRSGGRNFLTCQFLSFFVSCRGVVAKNKSFAVQISSN